MKVMAGALVAVLTFVAPALAQTPPGPALSANCINVPAPPPAPDGATISHQEMTRQRAIYDAWQASYSAQRERCRADVSALEAQAAANTSAFNEAQAPFAAVSSAWVTQVDAFNARTGNRRERDPRSINR